MVMVTGTRVTAETALALADYRARMVATITALYRDAAEASDVALNATEGRRAYQEHADRLAARRGEAEQALAVFEMAVEAPLGLR